MEKDVGMIYDKTENKGFDAVDSQRQKEYGDTNWLVAPIDPVHLNEVPNFLRDRFQRSPAGIYRPAI